MIEDSSIDETSRKIVDSKLVFCKNHNLLMYSKSIMIISEKVKEESKSENDSSDENEVSDVNDSTSSFQ
jgi:hypothetical protein